MTFAYHLNLHEKYDSQLIALLNDEQGFNVLCLYKRTGKIRERQF